MEDRICKICGAFIDSGGMNCPKEEHPVCSHHCDECQFHKSAGITIEICRYIAAKEIWKQKNMFFYASPAIAEYLRETLKISDMSDNGLKETYKITRQRLKENHRNKEAYRHYSEMLFVLAGEIEKRNLFWFVYKN